MARQQSRSSVTHALHTLELSEARWQAVLATARDAIIGIDPRGTVTLFNQAAEEIFGYAAIEVVGKNVKMLMPPAYAEQHDQYLENYRKTRQPKAIGRVREVEARRKSGEVFPIELSVSEARVGRQVLYSAIIRDVSDRRRAQGQLIELQKLAQQRERLADVGAITAKVVHDVGNPLAGLMMQAQLILRRAQRGDITPQTAREPAERIISTVRRLDSLVKEFMAFAREQHLDLRDVLLPRLLHDTVSLWQPVAAVRAIAIEMDPNYVGAVRADERQLRRVLDNLIKNAIEAIDHGPGRVDVLAAAPTEQTVRISIADTGPGFPETIEGFRLFETTKPDGTGLGLAVAKQIMVAHGGSIEFARLRPRGTVFHLDLPRRREAATV
jgi:two-component system, LuxR family, sensor kinase FixL